MTAASGAATAFPSGTEAAGSGPRCRFCGAPLSHTFIDLGVSPLCEAFVTAAQLNAMEPFYPLHALVCDRCWLVQLQEYVAPADIFSEYAYFSSYSDSWVEHARRYTELMCERFHLNGASLVTEIASNDGYLLQHFVARAVPVLGIEPAANVAAVARAKGIRTEVRFFGRECARSLAAEFGRPDLLVGNNVLAHVPDLNDFVAGMKLLLKPGGVLTMEFPHLERLIDENQFDTIYHEHFSYFSFGAAQRVFAAHGLTLFDVEALPTHGGSLRIYAGHAEDDSRPITERARALQARERARGFETLQFYADFGARVQALKRALLSFLIGVKQSGKSIVGYGAPGKGNTLLNYCGIRTDFLHYIVDRNPYKHGRYTPGTHIPIHAPERIGLTHPDYILILPWNLRDEIVAQLAYTRAWGCKFVVPIPTVAVLD